MKYLKIKNKGLLDYQLITLIGGTTKQGDENLIGEFGTGLKYATAWLLRNNMDFKLFVGSEEVVIDINKQVVRGNEFEIITINGKDTSVTTKLGSKDFKGWHVIREIYSNALDEGGEEVSVVDSDDVVYFEECTTFYIQLVGEIKNVYDNWNLYFLNNIEPLQKSGIFSVYESSDKLRLYKRGVLIYEGREDEQSVFSYDLHYAKLNELREFKGNVSFEIGWEILPKLNKKLVDVFINNVKGRVEEDWDFHTTMSDNWKNVIGNCKVISYEDYEKFKNKGTNIPENVVQVPKTLYEKLSESFDGISALRTKKSIGRFIEFEDTDLLNRINKEIPKLEYCGFKVPRNLEFVTGEFGNKEVLAKINVDEMRVYVSANMNHLSDDEIAAMIVEEVEHYNTGFRDVSREFQTHFIRKYTKLLYSKLNQTV